MRVGSPPSISAMWIDTSVNAAEPTAISVFVRKPGGALPQLALRAEHRAEDGGQQQPSQRVELRATQSRPESMSLTGLLTLTR